MEAVTRGENQLGIWKPKLSRSIIIPKNRREYIAPFLRYIFFYIFYVADGQLADDERAQAVAQQNKGHGHRESECAQNSVYGESGVYHFQIKYLGTCRKIRRSSILFLFARHSV